MKFLKELGGALLLHRSGFAMPENTSRAATQPDEMELVKASVQNSTLRFLTLQHSLTEEGTRTFATSRTSGSVWSTLDFSLEWAMSLPICQACGEDLIDGEHRLCSPCEAAEIMPLIRAFQQDL